MTTGKLSPRILSGHPPAHTPGYKSAILRSPRAPLIRLTDDATQTDGPVFGHNDLGPYDNDLLVNHASPDTGPIGERILLHGFVLDEDARPVPGTLVELWQANAGGRYRHRNDGYLAPVDPNFGGCGRTMTDVQGGYAFRTIKPGAYPWPNHAPSWRSAHIHLSIFGPAFAQRLITQCYFEGDPLIPLCPIVATVPDDAGVALLTARLDMDAAVPFDMLAYRFDIVLRGRDATPFEGAA